MTDTLSPERQNLLLDTVNVQERMLDGCEAIFSGLRQSSDPEVVSVSEVALAAIQKNRALIDAMIEGLTCTKH